MLAFSPRITRHPVMQDRNCSPARYEQVKILGLHLVMVLALYGCSTMTPARYSISADTNQLLKQFRGRKAVLTELVSAASYEPTCRLMGPIQAGDGLTIPQFVAKAFNDELKFADLYDEAQGVRLSGSMDKVAFSSASGWWDLAMTLRSEKGVQFSVEHRYTFTTSFDAFTACTQTAQALGAATQDLIKKTVSHPQFSSLLER